MDYVGAIAAPPGWQALKQKRTQVWDVSEMMRGPFGSADPRDRLCLPYPNRNLRPVLQMSFYPGVVGSSTAATSMVAALVGDDSRGASYLLTSVALAVSVMWLARRKVLVHEMSAVRPWPG